MKTQLVNVLYYRHNSQEADIKQERGYIFTLTESLRDIKIIASKAQSGYRLSEYRSGALIGHADKLSEVVQAAIDRFMQSCLNTDGSYNMTYLYGLIDKHINQYGRVNQ